MSQPIALPGSGVSAVSTNRAPRVVVVDDDQARARNVALLLSGCGINVECVTTPGDADRAVARYRPDMIMMRVEPRPEGDESDRVGSSGRPFIVGDLDARVRMAHRTTGRISDPERFESGGLSIDFDRRRARVGDREVKLSPKEFELLYYLASYPDAVVPHRAILTALWDRRAVHHPARLWALVTKVRRKIEPDPNEPRVLISEPWVGYRLALDRRS